VEPVGVLRIRPSEWRVVSGVGFGGGKGGVVVGEGEEVEGVSGGW
jgi:hypothetical protein